MHTHASLYKSLISLGDPGPKTAGNNIDASQYGGNYWRDVVKRRESMREVIKNIS